MGGPVRVEKYRADFRDGLPGSFFQRAQHRKICPSFLLWQSGQLMGNRLLCEQVSKLAESARKSFARERIAGKDLPLHMRSEVGMGRPRDVDLRCSALVVYTDGEQLVEAHRWNLLGIVKERPCTFSGTNFLEQIQIVDDRSASSLASRLTRFKQRLQNGTCCCHGLSAASGFATP